MDCLNIQIESIQIGIVQQPNLGCREVWRVGNWKPLQIFCKLFKNLWVAPNLSPVQGKRYSRCCGVYHLFDTGAKNETSLCAGKSFVWWNTGWLYGRCYRAFAVFNIIVACKNLRRYPVATSFPFFYFLSLPVYFPWKIRLSKAYFLGWLVGDKLMYSSKRNWSVLIMIFPRGKLVKM